MTSEEQDLSAEAAQEKEGLSLKSKKKLFRIGILIALVNPVFSGLIFGIGLWGEPEFKKQARIILLISIVWGVIAFYLTRWLISQGYLPAY